VTVGRRANVVLRPTADCQFRSRSYLLLGTKRIPAPIKGRPNDRPLMVNLPFQFFIVRYICLAGRELSSDLYSGQ
jgi:hypothetical protein